MKRLAFLDVLRGIAALVMVEVHAVNAFLWADFREQAWFPVLNYVNGLVAPAFLFVAGFAFAFTSERPSASLDERRSRIRKNIRRIGMVLAAGYMLHLPGYGWTKVSQASETAWLKFFQVDILHTIGVGLFILLFAREFLGGAQGIRRVAAIIGGGSILIAPWTWTVDAMSMLPAPMAAFVNGTPYSQFPLFPWLAFLMAGALVAATYPRAGAMEDAARWIRFMGKIGVGSLSVAIFMRWPEWAVGFPEMHIRVNPWFVVERLGVIMLLLWGIGEWSLRRSEVPVVLRDVSRETLLVYVAHLLIIYGDWFDGYSLAYLYKQQFGPLPTIAATIALMTLMVLAAWGWQSIKKTSERFSRLSFYGVAGIAVLVFFLR